jgi:dynein light chain LC8-type
MYDLMKDQCIDFIKDYLNNLTEEKVNDYDKIAENIKKYMDQHFGPPWHCAVGKDFGSNVTYKNRHFLYLYVANKAIMIYKH